MVCLEWCSYEALVLLAGLLPNPESNLAVMGVCFQVVVMAYMVPYGIAVASTTRISNHLGAHFTDAISYFVFKN